MITYIYNKIENAIFLLIFVISIYFGAKDFWVTKYTVNLGFALYYEVFKYFILFISIYFLLRLIAYFVDNYLTQNIKKLNLFNILIINENIHDRGNSNFRYNYKFIFIIISIFLSYFNFIDYLPLLLKISSSISFVLLSIFFKTKQKDISETFLLCKEILERDLKIVQNTTLKFGKYKGYQLKEILKIDPSYIDFIHNEMTYSYSSMKNREHFTIVKSYPRLLNELEKIKKIDINKIQGNSLNVKISIDAEDIM